MKQIEQENKNKLQWGWLQRQIRINSTYTEFKLRQGQTVLLNQLYSRYVVDKNWELDLQVGEVLVLHEPDTGGLKQVGVSTYPACPAWAGFARGRAASRWPAPELCPSRRRSWMCQKRTPAYQSPIVRGGRGCGCQPEGGVQRERGGVNGGGLFVCLLAG